MKNCHNESNHCFFKIPGRFKGRLFKKGHVILDEDIPELLNIEKRHIYILDIHKEYLHEDEAAGQVAGENLYARGPSEGKMKIKSQIQGLLKINEQEFHEIN